MSIVDGTFTRTELPAVAGRDSDLRLSGQVVVLASYRLSPNLFAFYEGRINHFEGLYEGSPASRGTYTNGVIQAYLRYTTNLPSGLNVQFGKFGHPFGQFLTRNYSDQHPLIAFPLMYTYRTTLRSNEVPYSVEELVQRQNRWRPAANSYTVGNYSYPTGVMAFGSAARADYRFALVNSSLSNPLNLGTPGQRLQWVFGGGVNPFQRLRIGSSFTAGPYLDPAVRPHLPQGARWDDFTQRALGMDMQLTLRHLELQGELLFTNYRVPHIQQRLGATGYFLELKHTVSPRLFVAGRWNQLYFDRVRAGLSDGSRPRFDQNRNGLEVGLGFRLSERLLAKSSYQFLRTISSEDPRDSVFGIQLVYSFDVRKLLRVP